MILKYKNNPIVSEDEIFSVAGVLDEYNEKILQAITSEKYEFNESTAFLPSDKNLLKDVEEMAKNKKGKNLKYIVVVGIGGSNLGTKAFYDAIFGHYDNLEEKRFPKAIFLDTQDAALLEKTIKILSSLSSKEEFLINAISKSGGTTETMTNLEILYSNLSRVFENLNERVVFTTVEGSKMHEKAKEKNISVLFMPNMVGGRYSVFSAVGLFPLLLLGFDVNKIRDGAVKMREICGKKMNEGNIAMISASILYNNYLQGRKINDNFIFSPQLESLGKWYRQLMGESIGKDGKGITPTVSIGSVDLHSMAQLYLDGPNDKVTTFINTSKEDFDITLREDLDFNIIPIIAGKSTKNIMHAIYEGTLLAYKKQGRPFMEVVFDKVDVYEISSFMQFKMLEMMYLGRLLDVNTFNQPAVEIYKIETKRILDEK